MTLETMVNAAREWFARVQLASLELPNGWFGRPYDNLHLLTWCVSRGDKLFVELDERLHLIITNPTRVEAVNDDLWIRGFVRTTFDWQEYGSDPVSHIESFTEGSIHFVAQGARPHL